MSASTFIDFKALRAAVTMEQALQHYNLLSTFIRYEDVLIGPCPIHKGKDSSQFRVSLIKNHWTCQSECPHGGNVLDFIALMEKVGIHTAALRAMAWFDIDPEALLQDPQSEPGDLETSTPPEPIHLAQKRVKDQPNTSRRALFNASPHPRFLRHSLTIQTVLDFAIGFSEQGDISIPIHNQEGKLVAQVGYSEEDDKSATYTFPPGFSPSEELFNLHRAKAESRTEPLVIVEGIIACMRSHQIGHRRVVALMKDPVFSGALSPRQEELIRQSISGQSQVVVLLDEAEGSWSRRGEIAVRLSRFVFVKAPVLAEKNQRVADLSAEDLAALLD